MKSKFGYLSAIYLFAFFSYLFLVVFLSKNAVLVYEWRDIINDFSATSDYRYKGVVTAYMPPLYPYYLLFFKKLLGGRHWIWASCVFQSMLFFLAMDRSFRAFFGKKWTQSKKVMILFCVVIFFPPILFGMTKVSSFSIAASCITLFLAELYSWKSTRRKIILIFLLLLGGIYLRYEFWVMGLLLATILFLCRKIALRQLILFAATIFVLYAPWCYRNYKKIGKFTYSTSLAYNFAKGNNLNYDVFSSSNLPFDPSTGTLTDDLLYNEYKNEVEKENYLTHLNKSFVQNNFSTFIELNVKKLAINFFQFFPDNNYFSYRIFPYLYSAVMIAITMLYFRAVFQLYKSKKRFEFFFAATVYLFFLLFYSVAPLPRYFLFFLPFFILVIGKAALNKLGTDLK